MARVGSHIRAALEACSVVLGLLALTAGGLAAGGALHLAGLSGPGAGLWIAVGSIGCAYVLWSMTDSLLRRRVGVDVIALLALLGALAVGEDLAAAVIAVMLASGRSLEAWAAGKARSELRTLLERAPTRAHRYLAGEVETVDLAAVAVGDVLVVTPGEVVPVDGTVASATAVLDESALTGEAVPVERAHGDQVPSGVVNAGSPFDLRVTTRAEDSAYAGIVRLVRAAETAQPPFVRLADRFAIWFVLFTLAAAGAGWVIGGPGRAVAVLVVATPCPLILAAPVAFVSGLSRTAQRGVVMKGADVLERLARVATLLLDKTGTLTSGRPVLERIVTAGPLPADEVLGYAASLDQVSPHLLADAIVRAAAERRCPTVLPEQVDEVPGQGVRGLVAGHRVAVGKAAWIGVSGAPPWLRAARRRAAVDGSMTVFVGVDGTPAGVLLLNDPIRADAGRTLRLMRKSGVRRVVMVTGDRPEVAESVGNFLGVDQVLAERSPADKLDAVRLERKRAPTLMIGDGINDAAALAAADVGVAMGARGHTASSEAADVVLTVDRLERVAEAKVVAGQTRRIAWQSVVAGMAMSVLAMGAALIGALPAVWGAVLQEGIDVAVIVNAMRALRIDVRPVHLEGRDASLSRRFHEEHTTIRADLDRIRSAADALGTSEGAEASRWVREVHRLLEDDIAPHEAAEEADLYPALGRLLGGADPTGPMSRGHAEIAHQIRRLGRLLDEIGDGAPDNVDIVELRSLLYGLHAVLELHTAQEEESYLSLADDVDAAVG